MRLQPFEMERWQSIWENQVEYNLAESGVHPLRFGEVIVDGEKELQDLPLGYGQTNGTVQLRNTIATLYQNSRAEDILVTNGSSEANFVASWSFLQRGAEVAIMLPNYMQVWGLAKTLGATLRPFWLRESKDRWVPDIPRLKKLATRRTKLIAVCNPNNPTGAVLADDEAEEICAIARKIGAWILSDEVYQGAELDGPPTASFWDRYDRVIVTNGLSKAYGLPGLRVGWVVARKGLASKLWSYHDYTTICLSTLSDYLARKVLQPGIRAKILDRTKRILRENLPILSNWVSGQRGYFWFQPPKAGAIAVLRYKMKIGSKELAEHLLREKSTLVVPGDHFNMGRCIRVGFGCPPEHLKSGLSRISEWLQGGAA